MIQMCFHILMLLWGTPENMWAKPSSRVPALRCLHGHIQAPTALCSPASVSWWIQTINTWAQRTKTTCCSAVDSYHRTSASSTATVRAWPRCRVPVTFGGGIHREKVRSPAWGSRSWEQEGKHVTGVHVCTLALQNNFFLCCNQISRSAVARALVTYTL